MVPALLLPRPANRLDVWAAPSCRICCDCCDDSVIGGVFSVAGTVEAGAVLACVLFKLLKNPPPVAVILKRPVPELEFALLRRVDEGATVAVLALVSAGLLEANRLADDDCGRLPNKFEGAVVVAVL